MYRRTGENRYARRFFGSACEEIRMVVYICRATNRASIRSAVSNSEAAIGSGLLLDFGCE
jgi:hypothetical protein